MNLSATEVIDAAKQIEAAGEAFYATALTRLRGARAREVFAWLRAEEERHAVVFEGLLGALAAASGDWRLDEQYQGHLRSMIEGRVFPSAAAARSAAAAIRDDAAAIGVALGFERDTIAYFEALRSLVRPEDREAVDAVIREERRHVEALERLLG